MFCPVCWRRLCSHTACATESQDRIGIASIPVVVLLTIIANKVLGVIEWVLGCVNLPSWFSATNMACVIGVIIKSVIGAVLTLQDVLSSNVVPVTR